MTENRTKGSQNPKNSFESPSRSLETSPEDYLKKLEDSFPERVQPVPNKGGDTKYYITRLLELYTLFLPSILLLPSMFSYVSISTATISHFLEKHLKNENWLKSLSK